MTEQVTPVVKGKRGPKVQKISEPVTNWPEVLKQKLKEKLMKEDARIVETYRTVGKKTEVHHVIMKLPDGTTEHIKSSRAPEWWGWIR